MKVVLSRKGFDSTYGGYPSFILPNDDMLSLPIPSSGDNCTYHDIVYKDKSYADIMIRCKEVVKNKTWVPLTKGVSCHLDPDLRKSSLGNRDAMWRGCFGQSGAAQSVLEKQGIGPGDIFLFFGWFNRVRDNGQRLVFETKEGFHAIFGYLQVDEKIYTARDIVPEWALYHPHMIERRRIRENNCLYLAREKASWNESMAGYGILCFKEMLQLTKQGMNRSIWNLPECFRSLSITYHSKNSWKSDTFQSAHRGQEFVVTENEAVTEWAISLIEKCKKEG